MRAGLKVSSVKSLRLHSDLDLRLQGQRQPGKLNIVLCLFSCSSSLFATGDSRGIVNISVGNGAQGGVLIFRGAVLGPLSLLWWSPWCRWCCTHSVGKS